MSQEQSTIKILDVLERAQDDFIYIYIWITLLYTKK